MAHKNEHPWKHNEFNNKIWRDYEQPEDKDRLFWVMLFVGILIVVITLFLLALLGG
jgi:hypothetical protein